MRTVTYGGACSLDGFITGPDGAMDWLHFSPDVQDVMGAYWATIDTVLMGRKTWEVAARSGGSAAPDSAITTYVFSGTLREAPPGTQLVSGDAGQFVRRDQGGRTSRDGGGREPDPAHPLQLGRAVVRLVEGGAVGEGAVVAHQAAGAPVERA